ncbi:MAG: DUF1786 family protein [Desulfobacterales bacterium]
MSRFLMVDIGAGTMDILYYDTSAAQHYKAVVKSPVQTVAERAAGLRGDLVVTGGEMGGGPVTEVLRKRATEARVVMSTSAAATLSHRPEQIRAWGIDVVDDAAAAELSRQPSATHLVLEDLDVDRLRHIVSAFGVPFEFDAVAVCAQDHGVPPAGTSHLVYRHDINTRVLNRQPFPHLLLYPGSEVPATLNRLKSIAAAAAAGLPTDEVYVMDSGMAAILGASVDPLARAEKNALVLDIATSHTVGATLVGGELAGFFEYHTRDLTLRRLESLLRELADGRLTLEDILKEGGHGAYVRRTVGFDKLDIILATGPKRRLVDASHLPITFGAPWGDNMMTGTVGLLEALRRCKDLEKITYL